MNSKTEQFGFNNNNNNELSNNKNKLSNNNNEQFGFLHDKINKSFLQKGDVMIISDIEGYVPEIQITKILDHLKNGNNLIYNGDVLDYTYNGSDRNNSPEKLCALTLLYHLVEGMKKGNVKCQIGNRELNKIKLLLTNLFLDENRKWWTKGNTLLEIAQNLVKLNNESITKDEQLWLVEDLKIINPFWAGNKENLFKIWKGVNKSGTKIQNASKKPKDKSLLERYNTIFGVDTKIGTISAQNNIIEMYKELGLTVDINDNELKAAIVFTVFARLLDKQLYYTPKSFTWFKDNKGINLNLDGYLYYYLVNGNPATYSKIKCNPETQGEYDTLLLFAHGGISLKFIETKDKTNNNKTSGTGLDLLNKVSVDEWKKIANIDYELTQKGGNVERAETIIDHIKKFNKQYNDKISELFSSKQNVYIMYLEQNNDVIYPSPLLQVLLSICTPADNNSIIKSKEYLTELSPIHTGTFTKK
jgi:hypothetical protein